MDSFGSDVLIQVRAKCGDCGGVGVVQHHLWGELFRQIPKPTDAQVSAFFLRKGYLGDPPPEEISCPTCDGTQWTEEWVTLRALHEMLSMM